MGRNRPGKEWTVRVLHGEAAHPAPRGRETWLGASWQEGMERATDLRGRAVSCTEKEMNEGKGKE